MGINISGIAINKNYENKVEELGAELGLSLEYLEENNFEVASENWKDEEYCDVYFSEKGTLLFLNNELCTDAWCTSKDETITFSYSETSMAFSLNYCQGRSLKRSFMEVDDNKMFEEGEPFDIEETVVTSDVIFNKIGELIGENFSSIDLGEITHRFRIKNTQAISPQK